MHLTARNRHHPPVTQQTPITMLGSTLNITGITNSPAAKVFNPPFAQVNSIPAAVTFTRVLITNRPLSVAVCAQAHNSLKINLNIIFVCMSGFCSRSVPIGTLTLHCVIADFRREADDNCLLLGCYPASSGNFLSHFGTKYRCHFQETRIFFLILILEDGYEI